MGDWIENKYWHVRNLRIFYAFYEPLAKGKIKGSCAERDEGKKLVCNAWKATKKHKWHENLWNMKTSLKAANI